MCHVTRVVCDYVDNLLISMIFILLLFYLSKFYPNSLLTSCIYDENYKVTLPRGDFYGIPGRNGLSKQHDDKPFKQIKRYHLRTGFDCEILMIASFS